MRLLRSLLLLATLVAILPWGAYAGHPEGATPAMRDAAHASAESNAAAIVPDVPAAAKAMRLKRCRIAAIPGAPCGPDLAVPGADAALPGGAQRVVLRPDSKRQSAGRTPIPPRDPPRSI